MSRLPFKDNIFVYETCQETLDGISFEALCALLKTEKRSFQAKGFDKQIYLRKLNLAL
jgi:hypothetical protein